jgi:hypothetical protein
MEASLRYEQMKAESISRLKRQESQRRISAVARARKSSRMAGRLQRRASLVGGAAKWTVLNFEQSFATMAKFAKSGE